MEIFTYTNIGKREENEDSIGYQKMTDGSNVCIVADGIGGYDFGAEASSSFVNGFMEYFAANRDTVLPYNTLLKRAFDRGDMSLKEAHAKLGKTMGTCAVAAIATDSEAHIAWLGDSRASLVRGGRIIRRTLDHSYLNHLRMNGHEPTDLEKECFGAMLSKAIHGFGDTEHLMELITWNVQKGDILFLSSDGFHNIFDLTELPESKEDLEQYMKANEYRMDDNCSFIRIRL